MCAAAAAVAMAQPTVKVAPMRTIERSRSRATRIGLERAPSLLTADTKPKPEARTDDGNACGAARGGRQLGRGDGEDALRLFQSRGSRLGWDGVCTAAGLRSDHVEHGPRDAKEGCEDGVGADERETREE